MHYKNYISENEKAYFFANGADRELINHLDLNILVGGEAARKTDLDVLHSFMPDPYFRLYYIVEGTVDLTFADGKYTLKPGHIYLIPALQPFKYNTTEGFTHYWLHFCSEQLEKISFYKNLVECPAPSETEHLMKHFLAHIEKGAGISALMHADIILRQLLIPFLELMPEKDYQQIKAIGRYQHVIDYINRNLPGWITVPELAKLAGMNRNVFTAEFHQAFGVPPKQYICNQRIGQAKILLLSTDLTIKQISQRVGYDNEFFFYRLFRKYTGYTPTEFRNTSNLGD